MKTLPFLKALSITGFLFSSLSFAQFSPPAPVISPEVSSNGDIVFRLQAPNASSVKLASSGDMPVIPFGGGLDMTKGDNDIWEVRLEGVDSGAYRYNFNVDGLAVMDPVNRSVSQSNGNAWSLLYVPGADFMDTQQVEHGAVAEVSYYSEVLGRHRRMHVYTPPGYQEGGNTYPVFYLLHGAMDNDDSWSTVGRAGFILDNLIAAGMAKPMVVVMPNGHTGPFAMGVDDLPLEDFVNEFKADIKPYVENHYRISMDRSDTAIAGLSMGGAHTLEIVMSDLGEYAYFGVFSSGVFTINDNDAWQQTYQQTLTDDDLRKGLNLAWFSIGSEDFLLETSKKTVDVLEEYGFDVNYQESTGGHTWINWRGYLNNFAPLLFK